MPPPASNAASAPPRRGSRTIEERIGSVAEAANVTGALPGEVRDAAAALSDHARRLRRSTDLFVEQLRTGDIRAA